MRLVYYGTPALAVPPLERLVRDGRPPLLVVTRRDRPQGRGQRVGRSPVRESAEALGLPVSTPARAGAPEEIERVRALQPDLLVLVAYGQILPPALLSAAKLGALNVHFSLLPRHRGASPVQAALLAGDRETGVTTMWMTDGLDEGPVFLAAATPIGASENAGALGARLAELGAECLARSLDRIERGEIERREQDASRATYAPKIASGEGRLPADLGPEDLARRVRAFTPDPGAYFELLEGRLLVTEAEPGSLDGAGIAGAAAGEVRSVHRERGIEIALPKGSLWLRRVRPAGRREMSGFEYANGARLRPGARLPLVEAP
ncbi:MAG TPA: methionyl-tRNA formyltransferase [Candidatus Eisenbacteria bacterium]|nr:methionyl-tRNA formyltransferase [Candidatus Eisenbacteria bacterium]